MILAGKDKSETFQVRSFFQEGYIGRLRTRKALYGGRFFARAAKLGEMEVNISGLPRFCPRSQGKGLVSYLAVLMIKSLGGQIRQERSLA